MLFLGNNHQLYAMLPMDVTIIKQNWSLLHRAEILSFCLMYIIGILWFSLPDWNEMRFHFIIWHFLIQVILYFDTVDKYASIN